MWLEQPEDRVWDLVTAFYGARRRFEAQYEAYESTVLSLAAERGVDRSELKLPALEVSRLLDFDQLDELHARHLLPLRELSGMVLRDGGAADLFDIYVIDIFHEIAILREEHVEVVEYGQQRADVDRAAEEAVARGVLQVLSEVHEYFPKRLHRVHSLFDKARARLDGIVGRFRENRVFIRSLYLFGQEEFPEPGELDRFHECVFDGGRCEGLLAASRSFLAGGFHELAQQALQQLREQGGVDALRAEVDALADELAALA